METSSPVRLYLLNALRFETPSEIRNINGIYGQLLGQIALGKMDQGGISRRELAGRLYPDVTDDRAKRLLSGALYRLKRDLGPFAGALVTDFEYVTLDNVWIDTLAFYDKIKSSNPLVQKEAVELYSGELLPNIDHPSAHLHRHRLHEAYLQAVPQVIDYLLNQKELSEALLVAHRWTLNEPFDDQAHLRAIDLYLQMGREGAAIKLYKQYAQRLETELGISPSAEMNARIDQIRAKRPVLQQSTIKKSGPIFIGRQREKNLIGNLIDQMGSTGDKVVFLHGEAGIGKSTMLQEISSFANWRQIEAYVSAADEHDNRPFAPLDNLLEAAIQKTDLSALKKRLPQITQQVLSRILPSFTPIDVDGFNGSYANNHVSLPTLKVALYQLLNLLTQQQPLILMIDDLQWVGSNVVNLLPTLVESTHALPLITIFAYRTTESRLETTLWETLRTLEEGHEVIEIGLAGLSTAETRQLATSFDITLSDGEISALHLQSHGNPLVIKEWIRNGKSLPQDVKGLFKGRLTGLSPAEILAVEVASVLGRSFAHVHWLALYPALAQMNLSPILERVILIEEEDGYSFENDLLREFIYQQQDPEQRIQAHRRAVQILEENQSDLQVLAWHCEQAGEIGQAIDYQIKSARDSVQNGAYDLAKSAYSEAKRLKARYDAPKSTALELLEYQIQQQQTWGGISGETIQDILDTAERDGDLETAHWAAIAHLRAISGEGNLDAIREAGERAISTVRELGDPQREILTLNEVANLAMVYTYQSEWPEALANEALDLLQQLPSSPYLTVTTLFTLIHLSFKLRNHERAQQYADQAEYYMTNHPELAILEAQWMHYKAFIAQTKGDIEAARELHNKRVKLGRVINEYRIVTASLFNSVYMARKLAQHDEMLIYAEELFQYVSNHQRGPDEIEMHFFRAFLADCYIVIEDLDRAEEILAPAIPWLNSTDSSGRSAFSGLLALGDLRHDQGRYDEAINAYQKIVDMPKAAGSLTYAPMLCLAQALSKTDRIEEARGLVEEVSGIMDLTKISNDLVYYYYVAYLAFKRDIYLSQARSTIFENALLIKNPKFRRDYLTKYPIARWVYREWQNKTHLFTVSRQVPQVGALNHRHINETELVEVVLTLDDQPHDSDLRRELKKSGLRQHRLKRLTSEAVMQGGALTQEELSQLLEVSLRTIERDIQCLREEGVELHTRNFLLNQSQALLI